MTTGRTPGQDAVPGGPAQPVQREGGEPPRDSGMPRVPAPPARPDPGSASDARRVTVAVVGGTSRVADALRALVATEGVDVRMLAGASVGGAASDAAVSLGIAMDPSPASVWTVPGVKLVLDLSDDPVVGSSLERSRPQGVELLGTEGSRLVWDVVRARSEGAEQARLFSELKEAYEVIRVQESRLRAGTEALERTNEALEHRLAEIFFTHEFFRALTSFSGVADVASLIVDGANGILGAEISAVYLLDETAGRFDLLASQGRTQEAFAASVPIRTTILARAISNGVVQDQEVDSAGDSSCWLADPASVASQAAVPLRSGEGTVGVLVVASARQRMLLPPEVERLSAIADQASLALQNALLHEELERLSVTDRLTELYNHGYFQQRLEQEIARANRFGHRLALVMLDIDDFKSFNDTFGHPRGDDVLRAVSAIIRATMRDMDVAARYGGEEFVLILPETAESGARSVAERIRSDVAQARFTGRRHGPPVARTVSLGVAVYPDDAATNTALIEAADAAMYRSKRAGKDRVSTAGEARREALEDLAQGRPVHDEQADLPAAGPGEPGGPAPAPGGSPPALRIVTHERPAQSPEPPVQAHDHPSDASHLKARLGTPIGRESGMNIPEGRRPWDSRRR